MMFSLKNLISLLVLYCDYGLIKGQDLSATDGNAASHASAKATVPNKKPGSNQPGQNVGSGGQEDSFEPDGPAALSAATYKHSSYSRNALPRRKHGFEKLHPVVVNVSFSFRQIHDIDEFHQIMLISVWQREFWRDEYISWDPADYQGTETLWVDMDDIWTPDLNLMTSGYDSLSPMISRVRVIVNYKGEVTFMYPILYHVACELDMK